MKAFLSPSSERTFRVIWIFSLLLFSIHNFGYVFSRRRTTNSWLWLVAIIHSWVELSELRVYSITRLHTNLIQWHSLCTWNLLSDISISTSHRLSAHFTFFFVSVSFAFKLDFALHSIQFLCAKKNHRRFPAEHSMWSTDFKLMTCWSLDGYQIRGNFSSTSERERRNSKENHDSFNPRGGWWRGKGERARTERMKKLVWRLQQNEKREEKSNTAASSEQPTT